MNCTTISCSSMLKNKHAYMVSAYSATHFVVDFACAFLIFSSILGAPNDYLSYLCILVYNFCAFAMQMPLGIIADKLNRNYLFAILGCVLVGLAYGLVEIPLAAVAVVGIGNAMFHIGGGIDVLNISEKKLSALGVFVAPGAFGVYYGTMLGKSSDFPLALLPCMLIAAATLIFAAYKAQRGTYPKNAAFSLEGIGSSRIIIIAACFFFVVCLRSFVGLSLNFPWKSVGYWGTALVCAVVFGKVIGGFVADRFGAIKTAVVSLSIASLLFLLPAIAPAGIVAVLLFNMTMPITLWAMAKMMPGAKGFAFGLLTFGLFIGFLPVYLGVEVPPSMPWLFALLAAGSLAILWFGLRRAKL